ncbi:MAG: family 43 glycosylhydrolase [Bacteroidales bacterium]|nr:family 43 glycosylhydrolase [Bacteroidales bacterium]
MKKLFLAFVAMATSLISYAQNPIIRDQFTADPTAKVFNGKVYLFPSHDIPAPDDYGRKDWFCMGDYHVFSSENLTDWTDHGVIIDQKNVEWGNPKGYSMWAPDCVEKNGKYYFYFPDGIKPLEGQRGGGFGIGVATADRPEGPWTVLPQPIANVSGIDPCVLQASDGNAYIYWGGGNLRGAKLKDNMIELSEDNRIEVRKWGNREMKQYGVPVDSGMPQGFREGTYVFERNGKFYLTYPWVEKNTETLAYAMSDNPLGPFEFKGKIMEESPTGCWTNHHSIIEYKGQWYLFYHHNDYSPNFDKLRSARIDSLFFNEDGTIQLVKPTLRGVGLVNARKAIQIDRYSSISPTGVKLDFLSADSTKRFEGWQLTYNEAGAYSIFNKVDFGQTQANLISVRVKAPKGGNITVKDLAAKMPRRWGNREIPAEFMEQMKKTMGVIATIEIPANSEYTVITLPINSSPRGVADLQIISNDEREVSVDWIGFDMQYDIHPALSSTAPLQPWKKGGLETHQYRNLFAELGYTQEQIDKKLDDMFYDLFYGPDRIYFELPNNEAIISDVKNHDARTEGMSYGMMIAVQLDKKDVFDRIYRWAKNHMQMKDGNQKGYFAWSVKPDGTGAARGAAADGELYFITSLIFASNRWGNDTGINYLKEAQEILDVIMGKEGQPRLIDATHNLIAFTPGSNYTDPSYHLPAFYEVWAKYAQDGRSDYWMKCAKASREYLHKSVHPITGLNPDYNNFDGSLRGGNGGFMGGGNNFRYDSWRVPMNIALDYSWSNADAQWQTEYGHKLQNFLYKEGIDSFLDQYEVDGSIPTDTMSAGGYKELRHTPGFIATAAALSLVCEHSKAREFVDRFWNNRHDPAPSGYKDAYYEGLLRLFACMHLSGRYQVIEPKATKATGKTNAKSGSNTKKRRS